MDEKDTPEQPKEEQPKDMPKLADLVDRLEKANADSRELLQKHEEMVAKKLIGGETDGTPQPEKKEETPQEYKDRIMRGEI